MQYSIYTSERAEDFSDKLESLFESHSRDFKPPLAARDKDIQSVVSNFSTGRKIVYATDGSEEDKILGFLLINPVGFRDIIRIYCPCHYVNLALVVEEFRGAGIGTDLLNKAIDEFLYEGDQYLALRTREDNNKMQSVVESVGFNFVGSEMDNGHERLYYVYKKDS